MLSLKLKQKLTFTSFLFFLLTAPAFSDDPIKINLPKELRFSKSSLKLIQDTSNSAKALGSSSKVFVVANSKNQALLAKILLHSYGMRVDQVEVEYPKIFLSSLFQRKNIFPHFLSRSQIKSKNFSNAIIVLGTMPLDESTPTVDMVERVLKGLEIFDANPKSVLVMTGGYTQGPISEAQMMGLVAWSRGINPDQIVLEEKSASTIENAKFTGQILKDISFNQIFLVTRSDHLQRALPIFGEYAVFKNIKGVSSSDTFDALIKQMQDYLKFKNSALVGKRLEKLKQLAP